jgi:hypothetical protein
MFSNMNMVLDMSHNKNIKTSYVPARCSEFFLFKYRKISHDNMYVILIWKKKSINTRSITDAISDIISHDFFQPLIPFLFYGKKMEMNIK